MESEAKKRPPGRPKKDPLEKGEQFSVRLDAVRKLELEILARDLGVSLSQAVDFAIKYVSEHHQVGGHPVAAVARGGFFEVQRFVAEGLTSPDRAIPEFVVLGIALAVAKTSPSAFRAFAMPAALRTEAEAFFVEVFCELRKTAKGREILDSYLTNPKGSRLEELFMETRHAQILGVDAEMVAAFKTGTQDKFNEE